MTDGQETKRRTALVIGGSRGLGRGVVEALSRRGARVVAVARDAAALQATATALSVEVLAGDAADELCRKCPHPLL